MRLSFLMHSLWHLWDLHLVWLGGFQKTGLPGSRYHIDHLYLIINILAPSSKAVTNYEIDLLPIEIINHSHFSITLVKASWQKEENQQRNPYGGQIRKHPWKCSAGCFQTLCGSVRGQKHSHFRRVKCQSLQKETMTTVYRCYAGCWQHWAEWCSWDVCFQNEKSSLSR